MGLTRCNRYIGKMLSLSALLELACCLCLVQGSPVSMSGAIDALTNACLKSVVASNNDLKALTWMYFTMYTCAASDEDGCKAMLAAGKVPFNSQDDIFRALQNAASEVEACLANQGRGLKAWGSQIVFANPAVDVTTPERICSNAAKFAKSGQTLPELDEFGVVDGIAAIVTGLSQATLATVAALGATRFPVKGKVIPGAAIATNTAVGVAFGKLFYTQNEADCRELYGEQGCVELGNAYTWDAVQAAKIQATGPKPDGSTPRIPRPDARLLAWGRSNDCKTCSKDLTTICLNHVAEYNKKFKTYATVSNAVGIVANGWVQLADAAQRASVAAATETAVINKALMAGIVTPIWNSWKAAQAAAGRPDWTREEILDALQTARKWQERVGVPKGPATPTPPGIKSQQGPPASNTPSSPQIPTPTPTPKPKPQHPTPPKPVAGTTYTSVVGGTTQRFALCACEAGPCNAPVGGGFGVRMIDSKDCVNCFESYPCPASMKCAAGKPSAGQEPSMTFSTCV